MIILTLLWKIFSGRLLPFRRKVMTYFKFRIVLILILLPVTSYYLFKFFSALTGISIGSAVAMSFRFDSSVPAIHRVMAFLGFFMYLCMIVALLGFLEIPKQIYEFDKYHRGGLMGYNPGFMHTVLYDPAERRYNDYYLWGGPPTPERFTDTFGTVLIYKPPSQDYYQDASFMDLPANIVRIVIILVSLFVVYICLFLMAQSYSKIEGLGIEPDHRVIADRFREISGMPYWKVAAILFSVLLIITLVSAVWIQVLNHRYNRIYEAEQKSLKTALMARISPGDTVSGTVIRRFRSQEQDSRTEEKDRGVRRTTTYYTIMHYTVEFNGLINIPVYLSFPLYPGGDESNLLEKAFTKEKAAEPETAREYDFIVNRDYSVSLKMEKDKEVHGR